MDDLHAGEGTRDHPKGGGLSPLDPMPGRGGTRPGLVLWSARWIGRAVVPFFMLANLGCYLGSLTLLQESRATHTGQLDDWRVATVVLLVAWQASWLHFLQRQPWGTFIGSLALWSAAILVGGFAPLALQPGMLVAAFSFAAERSGPLRAATTAVAAAFTTGVFVAADAFYAPPGTPVWHTPAVLVSWLVTALAVLGFPIALGSWYAQLRDRSERIAALAHQVAGEEALRTAEAVSAERRTLAQELHDTSSAHLAAVLALSTAARVTTGPAQAQLVEQIRDEGERLYAGFEELLTRMRQEDRTTTDVHRPGHGQRSVVEMGDLAGEHHRSTGATVTLRHDPDLEEINRRLGPMRSHIAYRVMQEALTNARKHAPGADVTVTVEDDQTCLLVRVENDAAPEMVHGSGGASAVRPLSLGYGLEGMRDRLAAAGGSLRIGPRHDGGWRVHALLPHPPHRDAHRRPVERPARPSSPEGALP